MACLKRLKSLRPESAIKNRCTLQRLEIAAPGKKLKLSLAWRPCNHFILNCPIIR